MLPIQSAALRMAPATEWRVSALTPPIALKKLFSNVRTASWNSRAIPVPATTSTRATIRRSRSSGRRAHLGRGGSSMRTTSTAGGAGGACRSASVVKDGPLPPWRPVQSRPRQVAKQQICFADGSAGYGGGRALLDLGGARARRRGNCLGGLLGVAGFRCACPRLGGEHLPRHQRSARLLVSTGVGRDAVRQLLRDRRRRCGRACVAPLPPGDRSGYRRPVGVLPCPAAEAARRPRPAGRTPRRRAYPR